MPIRYAEPLLRTNFLTLSSPADTFGCGAGRCDGEMRGHASWEYSSALRGLQLESFDSTRAYECLGSRSCENQRQEVFLQANAFCRPKVFELNPHAIRPDRSDH